MNLFTEKASPKMLDCFCGMGGVSDGFAMEGFDVTGIDIVDAPKQLGYKHRFIQADMMRLNGEDFKGFDVVWASPPCVDFSTANCSNKTRKGRKAPDPERGLLIIRAFRRFVDEANPKIWLMENVPRTIKFYSERPKLFFWVGTHAKRALWSNYEFPMLNDIRPKRKLEKDFRKLTWKIQSNLKAKIPLPCSRAFARACKQRLSETIQ